LHAPFFLVGEGPEVAFVLGVEAVLVTGEVVEPAVVIGEVDGAAGSAGSKVAAVARGVRGREA